MVSLAHHRFPIPTAAPCAGVPGSLSACGRHDSASDMSHRKSERSCFRGKLLSLVLLICFVSLKAAEVQEVSLLLDSFKAFLRVVLWVWVKDYR